MVIKEFILQGIRRFREPIRFQLDNGLNVLIGGNEKGKTTVSDALFSLLSVALGGEQSTGLRNVDAKEIRLGVTFKEGPDTFRLLMDAGSDAVLFSRYNQEMKKFVSVSKDAAEIRDFFKRDLLFKPLDRYKDLYLIDSYTLLNVPVRGAEKTENAPAFTLESDPSGYLDTSLGQAAGFEPTSLAGQFGQQENMTREEMQVQIEKLEEDLKLSSDAAAQQEKIDRLDSDLTDIQDRIKTLDGKAAELQETEQQVNALNRFSDLPDDIEKRIDDYVQFEARMKKEIDTIERQKSQYAAAGTHIDPFYKDNVFIAGGAILLIFIVAPVLLSLFVGSWGIYLSAGIFAGLGMMGYALWSDTNKRSALKSRQNTVSALEKQIQEQKKKYEIEGSVLTSIITSMQLESPAALKEGIKRYKEVLKHFAAAKKGYDTARAENDRDALTKQEEQIKAETEKLQEQVRSAAGSGMDPYSISQEIEALKKRLQDGPAVPAPQKTGPVVPGPPVAGATRTEKPAAAAVPAFLEHMDTIAGLAGDSRDRIMSLTATRASAHFNTLSGGTFREISFLGDAIVPVGSSGRESGFNDLSGSMKEKTMFSVFMSLLELAVEKWPWPVVMDEPFVMLDETNRTAAYGMVKALSKETQVIYLTRDAAIKPLADVVITL